MIQDEHTITIEPQKRQNIHSLPPKSKKKKDQIIRLVAKDPGNGTRLADGAMELKFRLLT
jgi:hypothetical protein